MFEQTRSQGPSDNNKRAQTRVLTMRESESRPREERVVDASIKRRTKVDARRMLGGRNDVVHSKEQ